MPGSPEYKATWQKAAGLDSHRKAGRSWYQRNKKEICQAKRQQYRQDATLRKKIRLATKRWAQSSRGKTKAKLRRVRAQYGLTNEDFLALIEKQQGCCMICTSHFGNKLCVDHDHITGNVRGLLCSRCNRAIGFLEDDPKLLEAGAQYLRGKKC